MKSMLIEKVQYCTIMEKILYRIVRLYKIPIRAGTRSSSLLHTYLGTGLMTEKRDKETGIQKRNAKYYFDIFRTMYAFPIENPSFMLEKISSEKIRS